MYFIFHTKKAKQAQSFNTKAARTSRTAIFFTRKEPRKFQTFVKIIKPHTIAINSTVLQLLSRSLSQRFIISDEFPPDSAVIQFNTNSTLFDPKPFYIFFRNFAYPFVPSRFFLSARAALISASISSSVRLSTPFS